MSISNHESGAYYTDGAAEPVPVTGQELKYPSATETLFDGVGRKVAVVSRKFGDETKRTVTSYTGDTTTIVPPRGGTAVTTVTDALGRTTDLKQYTDAARTKSQSTAYMYNKLGQLAQLTDPSGAVWKYGYDAAGRQNHMEDPDKGISDTAYDQGGRPVTVTDGRKVTLTTTYDELGRPTELLQGTTKRADWEYDKASKGLGQLYSTSRYEGSARYMSTVVGYNAFYKPTISRVTIPAAEGALAGTYEWTDIYNPNTGHLMESSHPAMGGLPAEDVINAYGHASGLPMAVSAGGDTLLSSVTYDHYGRPAKKELGAFGRHLWLTSEYDEHTGDLTRALADREAAPGRIDDVRYSYDPAGNVTRIGTTTGQDATAVDDTQCFARDALRQVIEAWTATDNCTATAPVPAVIGGPDPYWTTYTYDVVGNRKTETQHTAAAGPASDIVRTYATPKAGTHNLPGVSQTGAQARTETYTYDDAGNMETRKIGNAAPQALKWDAEGHLQSVTQATQTSSYLYGSGGDRIVRRDSTGTTLYLPFGNELHLDKAGKVSGTRYYAAGGETVAMRTGGKLTFLVGDHHRTTTTQVSADASQTVTRRKTTIFGAPRGIAPSTWSGDKGFVGGTMDKDSGLTHLGAREYDPDLGRFVSVDPLFDLTDPQQMNGYTYANNDPITKWDPDGLRPMATGGSAQDEDAYDRRNGTVTVKKPGQKFMPTADPYRKAQPYPKPGPNDQRYLGPSGEVLPIPAAKRVEFLIVYNRFLNKEFKYQPGTRDDESSMKASSFWGACQEVGGCADDYYEEHIDGVLQEVGLNGKGRIRLTGRGGPKPAAKCAVGSSFLPGTQVLMADGTTKPIEKVEIGDRVLAADPETGESRAETITAEITSAGSKNLVRITIAPGQGAKGASTVITATDAHPFWVPEIRKWVDATELEPGQYLLTGAGVRVQIVGVARWTQEASVYNLTVGNLHTYYVLAADTSVLVHNDDSSVGTVFRDGSFKFQIFSNDHGPAHGHLMGPGIKGHGIQIGQNGKPLDPNLQLNRGQQEVIDKNLSVIRKSIRKSMAAYRLNKAKGC
ncbi:polymorphic toxin-type HINT domain-containing protein [Streptomyces microflavus]|uniref:polymorphic toxin-type HINT domain-containing protein n=1 Tax=Streptomyces microflavus TaxID=1919 RepID=UPI003666C2E3